MFCFVPLSLVFMSHKSIKKQFIHKIITNVDLHSNFDVSDEKQNTDFSQPTHFSISNLFAVFI